MAKAVVNFSFQLMLAVMVNGCRVNWYFLCLVRECRRNVVGFDRSSIYQWRMRCLSSYFRCIRYYACSSGKCYTARIHRNCTGFTIPMDYITQAACYTVHSY